MKALSSCYRAGEVLAKAITEGVKWEDTFQDLTTQMGTAHSRERYWQELRDACAPPKGKTEVLFCTNDIDTEVSWNVYQSFDNTKN